MIYAFSWLSCVHYPSYIPFASDFCLYKIYEGCFCRGKTGTLIQLVTRLLELILGAHIGWKFVKVLKDQYLWFVSLSSLLF